jgi:hypothetical protein
MSNQTVVVENNDIKLELTQNGQISGLSNKTTGTGFIHTNKSVRFEIQPDELKIFIFKRIIFY